jgi:GNAT superfamily N-acetyltransferase
VDFEIRIEPFDSPSARLLIEAVQQEYVWRYGGRDATPVDPAQFAPPRGLFLVVYADGIPVGCGGWRVHGMDAEIKRMFVIGEMRGRGLARRLLAEIEASAAAAGLTRTILETGLKQPEAIALYESSGYTEIPGFGIYAAEEDCRSFAKMLAGAGLAVSSSLSPAQNAGTSRR